MLCNESVYSGWETSEVRHQFVGLYSTGSTSFLRSRRTGRTHHGRVMVLQMRVQIARCFAVISADTFAKLTLRGFTVFALLKVIPHSWPGCPTKHGLHRSYVQWSKSNWKIEGDYFAVESNARNVGNPGRSKLRTAHVSHGTGSTKMYNPNDAAAPAVQCTSELKCTCTWTTLVM